MNTRTATRNVQGLGLILVLAGALTSAPAHLRTLDPEAARANREVLSLAIADQGNRALNAIRADSRAAIRSWELPALPAAGDVIVADR
jgi:hypothetical protein